MTTETAPAPLLSASELLAHWQGHRKLTRRAIEAFPEDKLFVHSIGDMRSFGEMAAEMIGMGMPTVRGIISGTWEQFQGAKAETKNDLLQQWDEQTEQLDRHFPEITPEQFRAIHNAFGKWPSSGTALVQYFIDNEIHHRGQGYVYLRSLGIEPPPFWDRY